MSSPEHIKLETRGRHRLAMQEAPHTWRPIGLRERAAIERAEQRFDLAEAERSAS